MSTPVPAKPPRPARAGPLPPARRWTAGSDSPTDAASPASCPRTVTGRCSSGVLHEQTDGLVELAAGRRRDGALRLSTRERSRPLPPRRPGRRAIVARGPARAGRAPRRPRRGGLLVAPAVRHAAARRKDAVAHTRWLWVDVDLPGQLPALWAFLADRPCHLLVQTGGSGGVHAYWKLDRPLAATHLIESDGRGASSRSNAHTCGSSTTSAPTRTASRDVADPAVKDRSRVLRLAGTVNYKTGEYARILEADFAAARLPDRARSSATSPTPRRARLPATTSALGGASTTPDPYKRISPPEYFEQLAGIDVPRGGLVSCPAPRTRSPSVVLGRHRRRPRAGAVTPASCGARGAIYDLASVLLGGPHGRDLRGDAFKRARAYVADVFGDLN